MIRFGTPLSRTLTRCRFGNQRRFVILWACETLLPAIGFLPHTLHILAIANFSPSTKVSEYIIYSAEDKSFLLPN